MATISDHKTIPDTELGVHLSDLNAFLKHFLIILESQESDTFSDGKPVAHDLANKLRLTIQKQHNEVAKMCKIHASTFQTAPKQAVTSMLGGIAGMYNQLRDYPATRALRDNYAAVSLLIASLTSLKTFGLMTGHEPVSKMAYDHLAELCPLVVELSQRMPETIAREVCLKEEVPLDSAVVDRVSNAVKRCWS